MVAPRATQSDTAFAQSWHNPKSFAARLPCHPAWAKYPWIKWTVDRKVEFSISLWTLLHSFFTVLSRVNDESLLNMTLIVRLCVCINPPECLYPLELSDCQGYHKQCFYVCLCVYVGLIYIYLFIFCLISIFILKLWQSAFEMFVLEVELESTLWLRTLSHVVSHKHYPESVMNESIYKQNNLYQMGICVVSLLFLCV